LCAGAVAVAGHACALDGRKRDEPEQIVDAGGIGVLVTGL